MLNLYTIYLIAFLSKLDDLIELLGEENKKIIKINNNAKNENS